MMTAFGGSPLQSYQGMLGEFTIKSYHYSPALLRSFIGRHCQIPNRLSRLDGILTIIQDLNKHPILDNSPIEE